MVMDRCTYRYVQDAEKFFLSHSLLFYPCVPIVPPFTLSRTLFFLPLLSFFSHSLPVYLSTYLFLAIYFFVSYYFFFFFFFSFFSFYFFTSFFFYFFFSFFFSFTIFSFFSFSPPSSTSSSTFYFSSSFFQDWWCVGFLCGSVSKLYREVEGSLG